MNVTLSDVREAFARFVAAADRAGFPNTDRWRMQTGSKMYGHAYRVFEVDPSHGGHHDLPMMSSAGYVGMTRREAYETLNTMSRTMDAVAALTR